MICHANTENKSLLFDNTLHGFPRTPCTARTTTEDTSGTPYHMTRASLFMFDIS